MRENEVGQHLDRRGEMKKDVIRTAGEGGEKM